MPHEHSEFAEVFDVIVVGFGHAGALSAINAADGGRTPDDVASTARAWLRVRCD
jgi:succinate dehydrogenase/fumarate reductase flavoprotein subunit